jgi:hypothetical protein
MRTFDEQTLRRTVRSPIRAVHTSWVSSPTTGRSTRASSPTASACT